MPERPVEWSADSFPNATLGNIGWSDYTVGMDVRLDVPGEVQLLGRVGSQARLRPAEIDAYALRVANTGAWSLVRTSAFTPPTALAAGVINLPASSWHRLDMTFRGSAITPKLDGRVLTRVTDGSYRRARSASERVGTRRRSSTTCR